MGLCRFVFLQNTWSIKLFLSFESLILYILFFVVSSIWRAVSGHHFRRWTLRLPWSQSLSFWLLHLWILLLFSVTKALVLSHLYLWVISSWSIISFVSNLICFSVIFPIAENCATPCPNCGTGVHCLTGCSWCSFSHWWFASPW